jgi:hypothetical protein
METDCDGRLSSKSRLGCGGSWAQAGATKAAPISSTAIPVADLAASTRLPLPISSLRRRALTVTYSPGGRWTFPISAAPWSAGRRRESPQHSSAQDLVSRTRWWAARQALHAKRTAGAGPCPPVRCLYRAMGMAFWLQRPSQRCLRELRAPEAGSGRDGDLFPPEPAGDAVPHGRGALVGIDGGGLSRALRTQTMGTDHYLSDDAACPKGGRSERRRPIDWPLPGLWPGARRRRQASSRSQRSRPPVPELAAPRSGPEQ